MKKGPAVLLVLGLFTLIVVASWQPTPKRSAQFSPSKLSLAVAGELNSDQETYARLYLSINQFLDHYLQDNKLAGEWGLTERSPDAVDAYAYPPNANFLLWADLNFESKTDTLRFCQAINALPGIEVRTHDWCPTSFDGTVEASLALAGGAGKVELENGLFFCKIDELGEG